MLFLTTDTDQRKPDVEIILLTPIYDLCRRCGEICKVDHPEDIYCRRCIKEMMA
jgi:hypothetical protein